MVVVVVVVCVRGRRHYKFKHSMAGAAVWDVVVIGGGPVGLMCTYLGSVCGLRVLCVDRTEGPLQVGRADALNARTLQLMHVAGLFEELYSQGKTCNTSSVWADGAFVSRQSAWWDALEGCQHKHFLMLGQAFVERALDARLGRGAAAGGGRV